MGVYEKILFIRYRRRYIIRNSNDFWKVIRCLRGGNENFLKRVRACKNLSSSVWNIDVRNFFVIFLNVTLVYFYVPFLIVLADGHCECTITRRIFSYIFHILDGCLLANGDESFPYRQCRRVRNSVIFLLSLSYAYGSVVITLWPFTRLLGRIRVSAVIMNFSSREIAPPVYGHALVYKMSSGCCTAVPIRADIRNRNGKFA